MSFVKQFLYLEKASSHYDSQLCVSGCGGIESTYHLFFGCNFFGIIWQHVRQWLGFSLVVSLQVLDHFV